MITDTDRLDFLENTLHVLCYDNGDWFCAWRSNSEYETPTGWGWTDRPMSDTVRGAIDAAMELVLDRP